MAFIVPGWRLAVEVDARDGGMGAFKNDVLGFLHVQMGVAQSFEHVCEHARLVAMPHHEHVRRRGLLRQVHDVGHPAGCDKRPDDTNRFGRNRLLRLVG